MSVCRPRFCEFREILILIHFLLQPLGYQLGQYMYLTLLSGLNGLPQV